MGTCGELLSVLFAKVIMQFSLNGKNWFCSTPLCARTFIFCIGLEASMAQLKCVLHAVQPLEGM